MCSIDGKTFTWRERKRTNEKKQKGIASARDSIKKIRNQLRIIKLQNMSNIVFTQNYFAKVDYRHWLLVAVDPWIICLSMPIYDEKSSLSYTHPSPFLSRTFVIYSEQL